MSSTNPDAAASPRWLALARDVPAASFAFVMATGIVSAALDDVGQGVLSTVLLLVAVLGLVVLAVANAVRLVWCRAQVLADARDPARAFGFFTVVAAINVVGVALYTPANPWPTVVLAALSVPLWLLLSYGLPGNLILSAQAEPVVARMDGSWFLWVVGTQSLAVATATVGDHRDGYALAGLAVALWGIGALLYLMLATLVTLRLLMAPAEPSTFNPSYWIYMGATAITVLAGSAILALPAGLPVVVATSGVVSGMTYVLWAFGMWWVPLLLLFGFWRHVVRRAPVHYETGLWSIVFPLGMYAVASIHFGTVAELGVLTSIGHWCAWIAAVVWLLVTIAMLNAARQHISPTR